MKRKWICATTLLIVLVLLMSSVPDPRNRGLAQDTSDIDSFQSLAPKAQDCCGFIDPEPNTAICSGGNGNCVWWVFYKRQRIGNESQDEVDITACRGSYGNPDTWYDCVQQYYPHLLADTPAPHDIVIFTNGVQHAAYVESVNADGSFNVSQMSTTWSCANSPQYDLWLNEPYVTFVRHPGYMNNCCGCGNLSTGKRKDIWARAAQTVMEPSAVANSADLLPLSDPPAPDNIPAEPDRSNLLREDVVLTETLLFSYPMDEIDDIVPSVARAPVEPQRTPPASTNYRIPRSVFGSGGGEKTSTHYVMNTTQGQSTDLSRRESVSYVLSPGYWSSAAMGSHTVYLPLVVKDR